MIDIRAGILAVTICLIIFAAANQPKPVKSDQVDYCVITYKVAGKDADGEWHTGWARGYGPCSLLDRYENI